MIQIIDKNFVETVSKDATKTRNRSIYAAALRNQDHEFIALGFQEADGGSSADDLHKYYSTIMERFDKTRILMLTESICTDAGQVIVYK